MALLLRTIYEETKHKYHMQLICGASGLDRAFHWVYISEDISTTSFLQGDELIITTGMCRSHSPNWLYDYISLMIRQKTSGLILFLGGYLSLEDITPEIRQLCEASSYPLFTLPWEVRLFDITHDYYNRIFLESQAENVVTSAFLDLLHQDYSTHPLASLTRHGFPEEQSCCAVCISFDNTDSASGEEGLFSHVYFWLERYLRNHHANWHLCQTRELLILISSPADFNKPELLQLTEQLSSAFSKTDFYLGLGSTCDNLKELPTSYLHARAACSMGISSHRSFFAYDDLEFYKILLSVQDKKVLTKYLNEKLGVLLRHDEQHHSNYVETLHQYLLCDGSIQKIAAALFCHRNTINYRIHILKEEFGFDLENSHTRFELMIAYEILSFNRMLTH